MSLSFYGIDAEGKPLAQDVEDPKYLNMCASNAVTLLDAMGLKSEVGEDPGIFGEVSTEKALDAVWRCRRNFVERLSAIQVPEDRNDYFLMRLLNFEQCVRELQRLGAKKVCWA